MTSNHKIKTAVITGQHAYDVANFHAVFRNIPEIDFYPLHMEDFVTDTGKGRKEFDVLLFYNMHRQTPMDKDDRTEKAMIEVLTELGESNQGIFLLHHSILAFPGWGFWSDIVGIKDRSFGFHPNQKISIDVATNQHPITEGVGSWEMEDETYTMEDAGEGSEILLTAEHPKSMKNIAWTRSYKNARVFCFQSGHDNHTFSNPQFRQVISQGIQWLARRI